MLRFTRMVAWGAASILWTATALAQPEQPPPDDAAAPPDAPDKAPPVDEGASKDDAPSAEGEVLVVRPAQSAETKEAEVALDEARAAVARAEAALERIRRAKESGEDVDPEDVAAALDAQAMLIVWRGLRGKSIAARITALEDFVRDHAKSRYAVVMYEEAAALRELLQHRAKPRSSGSADKKRSLHQISFSAPEEAPAGQAFDIVVELSRVPKGPVRFQLQRSWANYDTYPMRKLGDRHYAFRIPASEVKPPGVYFYVDVDEGDPKPRSVVAGKSYPHKVEVKTDLEAKAAQQPIVEGWLKAEYADVNHFNGDDYLLRTWGAGSVRFGDVGLRRVSLGYSFAHVVTAGHTWLDHGPGIPYQANFGAAFVDFEFAPDEYFSLVARPIIGRANDAAAGGFRGGIRAGSDMGTNFLIAAEGVVGWGMLGIAQVEIQEIELVPITLRLEMSNMASAVAPLEEMSSGLWGRGIIEVGYRFHPAFEASGRLSVQGRGEDHAGAGIGGGVKVRW